MTEHHSSSNTKGGETETLSAALPDDVEQAAARVLELACARELTLATAESCTGGLLGSLLTDVEGASHAFERGVLVYSRSEEETSELQSFMRTSYAVFRMQTNKSYKLHENRLHN